MDASRADRIPDVEQSGSQLRLFQPGDDHGEPTDSGEQAVSQPAQSTAFGLSVHGTICPMYAPDVVSARVMDGP
jgi:hypothetical protein